MSVTVTLRGKKYDVKGATSVDDVQKSVEEQAGLAKEQQVLSDTWNVFLCFVGFNYSTRKSLHSDSLFLERDRGSHTPAN